VANTIRIKKRAASGADGAPSSLFPSELAFNESDLKLYYGFGDNGSTPPSASSVITVGGSGAFFNKTDTRTANTILVGPASGSAAAPTFRALVAADLLKLNEFTAPDGAVSLNSQKITSLATPVSDTDAATKAYVDSTAEGLDVKDSVKIATTANITLSGTQTIDGVAISADERVLVKDQSTASQNGIYLCKAGSWARADDMAASSDAAGAFTFVEQGSTLADTGFVCSTNKGSAVVGTNNLAFTQFSSAGVTTAGDGLDRAGNVFSVDLKSNGGLVIESTELAVDLGASSITNTLAIANGGTGATSASAARTALGLVIGTNIVAYAADLNTLSSCQTGGATALAALTSTEIAILDGATVTTAELNILDGVTSTASELNILDGVTSTTAELNILDGVTSTASELNILDGVTSTASELNVLDGITSTTTELNLMDGGTSATSTTLASADRFVCNDNGTMKQVALSDLVTYLEDGSTSGFDVDGGTY
tara:strand:- start:58 stop:1512 length:1455 start_codon:yes stop_codon:yes gene_type:complete